MRVYSVPKEYFSCFTNRLLHVFNSDGPASDQYSRDPSSSLIQATGHQLVSLCSSMNEGGEKSALESINDQLVLRNCSV